jgi:hypothetical protein
MKTDLCGEGMVEEGEEELVGGGTVECQLEYKD